MAVTSIHSSKTKPRRTSFNPRPLRTEQVHCLPTFQDANTKRSEVTAPSRLLDSFNRPPRRVLAHTHSPLQTTLARIFLRRPGLRVQRPSIRPELCSESLYESHGTCGISINRGRNMDLALPRRLSNRRSLRRILQKANSKGTPHHERHGTSDQRNKVSSDTSSKIRMARSTMGSILSSSPSNAGKSSITKTKTDLSHTATLLHHKRRPVYSRFSKLGRPVRPNNPAHTVYNKKNTEIIKTQGTRDCMPDFMEPQDAPLYLDPRRIFPSSPGLPSARYHHSNRRQLSWLRFPSKSATVLRKVRQVNELFNKRLGTDDSMVFASDNLKEKCSDTSIVRQHNHDSSAEEGRLTKLPSGVASRIDMETNSSIELDSTNQSHRWSLQYTGRPIVQTTSTFHRMVLIPRGLPENTASEPPIRSGLICNKSQQQAGDIRQSMPRSTSNSGRCTDDRLGNLEPPIHLSPVPADFPGFEQNQEISLQKCSTSNSGNSNETVVHGSPSTSGPLCPNGGAIATGRSRRHGISTADVQNSRVAVIREAYKARFPSCHTALDLLTKPLRDSSLRDYERKWLCFSRFLTERNINPVDLNLATVLEFLSYLFRVKNLRPGTVSHYRSALSVPLLLQYNIDLHDNAVSTLIKAMYIERPNLPASAPSWNLNKVLSMLDSMENNLPIDILQQKTAFLLLLSTGWRVSELHACVRNKEFCSITREDTLRIRPHPSFLAKNESPKQRWSHKTIKPLRLAGGSPGKLCPVTTLKEYLHRIRHIKSDKLWFHPRSQKPLTATQLGTYVCKLIRRADPLKKAKVHDVRKYAASCCLAETMDVSDMVTALQWSSAKTFWRFYLATTEPLSVPAVLPGTSKVDNNSMALTTLVDTQEEMSDE